ncbi:MAG: VOC family protein [Planctomycetota bacterium]|nr:VOC family protein [Planctomycetota bacterium]
MGSRPQAPTTFQVRGIDHVTLVVDDLERSRAFYCDILGMQLTGRPDFPFDGLWFQAGSTQVHLILNNDIAAAPGYPNASDSTQAGVAHHFAFRVDDAREAADKLRERGVRIMGGPALRPDGAVQVWFYDPDGHVVEVFHLEN